jgi:hypothetical protein
MTNPKPQPAHRPPSMEMDPETRPVYSNLARISHSPADMVLDFAALLPGESVARIVARIFMSPLSAKLLYRALGENLARYEAAFGEIQTPNNTSNLADHLFRPFQAPPDPPKPE